MDFEKAVELLQEFDYEKNGKEMIIDFLRYVAKELEDYGENKKIEKIWFSLYEMERVNEEVLSKIERKINEIIDYINKEKLKDEQFK